MRILLVEDNLMVAEGICEGLGKHAFAVDHLTAAEPAESALKLTHYELAIIDIGLPGISGHELIRRLRLAGQKVPLLILTARDGLQDRVHGLDLGADDYMVKPFHLQELLARMRALIRRSNAAVSSEISAAAISLNLVERTACHRGKSLDLTRREWEIMLHLVLACPNAVSKQKLVESLSQWENEITSNAIEIYVFRLRHKLRDKGINIRTIHGIGYRLDETDHA